MILDNCPARFLTGTAAVLNLGFCGFTQYFKTYSHGVVKEAKGVSVPRFPVYFSLHPFIQLLNCWQHPSLDLKLLYYYAPLFSCPLFLPYNLSHSICSLPFTSLWLAHSYNSYPPSSPHFSIHFVVCFVTVSWPFPKRVLQ